VSPGGPATELRAGDVPDALGPQPAALSQRIVDLGAGASRRRVSLSIARQMLANADYGDQAPMRATTSVVELIDSPAPPGVAAWIQAGRPSAVFSDGEPAI
jgi:hypothetical protein